MKKLLILLAVFSIALGCDDDDNRVFEKSADERASEAIANLRSELLAPPNGWKIRYRPVDETGAFYVLLKFFDDNKVSIKTDVSADERAYTNQVIGYRIDNSLGLELVLENYSLFHYLFEQDAATFGAEYEFDYVNKTPEGSLVFVSKTDVGEASTIVLEPAQSSDINLLGVAVDENLNIIHDDLDLFSSSIKIEFTDKDVVLYGGIDVTKRVINLSASTPKSNPQNIQLMDYESSYLIQGSSLILDAPLSGTFSGLPLSISSLSFQMLSEGAINVCTDPTPIHAYSGSTSAGDQFSLETTIVNAGGSGFTRSTIYSASLQNIRDNGQLVLDEIQTDLKGVEQVTLLYGLSYNNEIIYGIGFVLVNEDGGVTYAVKEFTPTLAGNNITFNFKPGFKLLLDQDPDADLNNIDKYILPLTEGDKTFVYKYADGIYEFNNPCSGYTIAFVDSQ